MTIALRGLLRSPAFTLGAMVTLALGIGANSTMFSVVNSILLRPLPGYETDRLMQVADTGVRNRNGYLPPEIFERLTLRSFEHLAANQNCRMNLTGQGEPEQLGGPCVTANWFDVQHAQAMLGRTFLPDENQHGRNHVVVLDHAFWQRRFAGDPNILNRKLILDNEPWLIVGVMPADFKPAGVDAGSIYTPYVVADHPHGLTVTGRLKSGVTRQAAQAELDVATAALAHDHPELKLRAMPLLEQVTGEQRPLLLLLLGAASFVLLIACVNVANLMRARAAGRSQEIGIRIALGATRWHILRFVLAEVLIVSMAASTIALGVTSVGLRLLKPLMDHLPRAEELQVDVRVFATTMMLGITAALLSGVLPALRSSTLNLRPARPQRFLIAGEVALAFVLLTGAGLLLQTFVAIRTHDLGYDPRKVLTSFVALPQSADGTRTKGVLEFQKIRERLAALPGVRGVATASGLPMFGVSISMDVHPAGEPVRKREHVASMSVVSDDYFRVMAIPLRHGRWFSSASDQSRVVMVSEAVAGRYFQSNAVGRRLIVPELKFNIDGGDDVAAEIIGVVGNVCVKSVEDCEAEHIYLPEAQNAFRMSNLLVRTEGDPKAMIATIRRAMFEVVPTVPLDDPQTLEERASYLTSDSRRAMWLVGVFAGLAILLAAAGIYSVAALLAAQRRREIGIRMALGAGAADIARLIYRSVVVPSAIGVVMGIAAAVALARLLRALLYGVSPNDPRTLAIAGVLLVLTAVVAATSPAVRASRTQPAAVLRSG